LQLLLGALQKLFVFKLVISPLFFELLSGSCDTQVVKLLLHFVQKKHFLHWHSYPLFEIDGDSTPIFLTL
jgi:hypothetical protein